VNGDRITYIVAEIKNLSTSEGEQAC
jgi:hypothetical protein